MPRPGRWTPYGIYWGVSSTPFPLMNAGITYAIADTPLQVHEMRSNDSGQVVGDAWIANRDDHAFLYDNGKMSDLGVLSGTYSNAFGINASGQIVGYSDAHAFLYSNGHMTDLGTLGGSLSCAVDINAMGQIVGMSYTANGDYHSFLFSNGTMADLNNLIDPSSDWTLTGVSSINDLGQIVGSGKNSSGIYHAVILTPIPEPATFILLGVGIVSLLVFAFRKGKTPRKICTSIA